MARPDRVLRGNTQASGLAGGRAGGRVVGLASGWAWAGESEGRGSPHRGLINGLCLAHHLHHHHLPSPPIPLPLSLSLSILTNQPLSHCLLFKSAWFCFGCIVFLPLFLLLVRSLCLYCLSLSSSCGLLLWEYPLVHWMFVWLNILCYVSTKQKRKTKQQKNKSLVVSNIPLSESSLCLFVALPGLSLWLTDWLSLFWHNTDILFFVFF